MSFVLGIDVGYSETKKTCSYCLAYVDSEKKCINLVGDPCCFCIKEAAQVLGGLFKVYDDIQIIALDAPLTPQNMDSMPKSGRTIDKVFSKSKFSNGLRGPQPSSISVPKPGWQLYKAGMDLVNLISELNSKMYYISMDKFTHGLKTGLVEIIPKLTQSLLVPQQSVTGRGKNKIDDYLFPRLFTSTGVDRSCLNNSLNGWALDDRFEMMITSIALQPKKYHEELAAIVAVIQGAMLVTGNSTIVGFLGDREGYYALPTIDCWHSIWKETYFNVKKEYPNLLEL